MKRRDACHGRVSGYEFDTGSYVVSISLWSFFWDTWNEMPTDCYIDSIQCTTSNYPAYQANFTVMFRVMFSILVYACFPAGALSLRGTYSSYLDVCSHLMSLRDQFCIFLPHWQLLLRPWRAITEQFAPMLLAAPSICHACQRMLPWSSQLLIMGKW